MQTAPTGLGDVAKHRAWWTSDHVPLHDPVALQLQVQVAVDAAELLAGLDQAGGAPAQAIRLAATIETWWPVIEAAILTGHTDAHNRLVKHAGRNASGFRNPTNQRHHIRWSCTRQHRHVSVTTTELPAQMR